MISEKGCFGGLFYFPRYNIKMVRDPRFTLVHLLTVLIRLGVAKDYCTDTMYDLQAEIEHDWEQRYWREFQQNQSDIDFDRHK
jgi:hypothetical protein